MVINRRLIDPCFVQFLFTCLFFFHVVFNNLWCCFGCGAIQRRNNLFYIYEIQLQIVVSNLLSFAKWVKFLCLFFYWPSTPFLYHLFCLVIYFYLLFLTIPSWHFLNRILQTRSGLVKTIFLLLYLMCDSGLSSPNF